MPRPKLYTEERVTTAVRLPRSLHTDLAAAAAERGLPANRLIIDALADYLPRLLPPEEVRWTTTAAPLGAYCVNCHHVGDHGPDCALAPPLPGAPRQEGGQ